MEWAGRVTQEQLRLGALGVAAAVLLVVTVVTSRRPEVAVPPLAGYLDRWQAVHGGYDPRTGSIWVRAWLAGVYRLARPLARTGVAPDVLTAWTLWLSAAALTAAAAGGGWVMAAGWLVVGGGIGDSLDGAVAVLTDRATRWGYVLDSVVDRINDVMYVAAVVVAGAPVWLGVVCAVSLFTLEYLRARGGNAGAGEIGTITVGERPNRVALCAVGLYFGGAFEALPVATAALALLAVLTLVGLGQLGFAVRRQLAS